MSKHAAVFFFIFMLFAASYASAGCVGVYGANSWEILDPNSLLIYDFSKPITIIKVPWCNIFNLSDICLKEDFLCTGDKVIIDKQVCEIRELIPIDINVNFVPQKIGTLTLYVKGSPQFTKDEFKHNFTVQGLLHEFKKDNFPIEFSSFENSVTTLNAILTVPDFYDMAMEKRKLRNNEHMRQLVSSTENIRDKEYSALSEDERIKILHLNRLVLEALYPQACPKKYVKPCPNNPK